MELNTLLKLLEQENLNLDVLFDVKDVESFQDFAHLVNCYSEGETLILEFR